MVDAWHAAAERLARAEHLLIVAGAGMGVDSGLPDFRGPEGLWRAYPPLARTGRRFEELARPTWFDRDPTQAWGFYAHRLRSYREVTPHDGFARLLAHPADRFVQTSNVDGQFQKAGFDPERILEAHGTLHAMQCARPCGRETWPADGYEPWIDEDLRVDALPVCPSCGGLARPGVCLFSDGRWVGRRTHAQTRLYRAWLDPIPRDRLVVLEIGAGTAVPAMRAESEALWARGASLIRINPREPEVPRGAIGLAAGAKEALSRLLS